MDISFTKLVQKEVDLYCDELIRISEQQELGFRTGTEYREFLNNTLYLNSTDFVIRRYLQDKDLILIKRIAIETNSIISDLENNLNSPWPDNVVDRLATYLFKQSKARRTGIKKEDWIKYLSSNSEMHRSTVFKIAFTIKMNTKETQELLLASGQNRYCMRDPLDIIVYFCQKRSNSFHWQTVEKLISEFSTHRTKKDLINAHRNIDSVGDATQFWTLTLDNLIKLDKQESVVQRMLIDQMLERESDFNLLEVTNYKYFMRFSEFLAVLYPYSYSKRFPPKETVTEEGVNLSTLISAMFESNDGWLSSSISKRDKKGKRKTSTLTLREMDIKDAEGVFLDQVQVPIDNLKQTVAKYKRIFSESINYKNVDRNIIILYTYFYIRKCEELLQEYDIHEPFYEQVCNLEKILLCEDLLAKTLNIIKKQIEGMENANDTIKRHTYRSMINLVLDVFNMHHLYLPSPFDRFIYISLCCGDCTNFIEAVMNNSKDKIVYDISEAEKIDLLYAKLEQYHPILLYEEKTKDNKTIKGKIQIGCIDFYIGRKSTDDNYYKRPDFALNLDKSYSRLHTRISFTCTENQEFIFYIADVSGGFFRASVNGEVLRSNDSSRARIPIEYLKNTKTLHNNDKFQIGDTVFTFIIR